MTESRPALAVLGFRPHTYWTAAVALAGAPKSPRVLERRRIVFAADDERSVYHHVEGMARAEAEAWLARVRTATVANTVRGIGELIADLSAGGVSVSVAVVPAERGKPPERLEDILRSHSRIHAAEGAFYRAVVAEACEAVGLEVRRVAERELSAQVCGRLGVDEPALEARVKAIGADIGPPWSVDQKLAMLAAWGQL